MIDEAAPGDIVTAVGSFQVAAIQRLRTPITVPHLITRRSSIPHPASYAATPSRFRNLETLGVSTILQPDERTEIKLRVMLWGVDGPKGYPKGSVS
jgi:hypothetical protein